MARPKKAIKEINPQIQFGRRCAEDVALVDAAAEAEGKSRAAWAWETLLRAARKRLGQKKQG